MRAKMVRLIAACVVMGLVCPAWAQEAEPAATYDTGYMGVDNVFTIREANPNVMQGQWEFELGTVWQTYKTGARRDDSFGVEASLQYGFTDTFNVELAVLPINLGDGRGIGFSDTARFNGVPIESLVPQSSYSEPANGNGETAVRAFWQFLQEEDVMPAMALWGELRLPTGDGSSGVDATLYLNMTKTFTDSIRGHFQGYLKAADGARGDFDREVFGDREDFQCGAGVGMDFALNEDNLLLVNYENRSSEHGGSSINSIEVGWVHHLAENQHLQVAGTYNDTSDPAFDGRWQARVQWAISF